VGCRQAIRAAVREPRRRNQSARVFPLVDEVAIRPNDYGSWPRRRAKLELLLGTHFRARVAADFGGPIAHRLVLASSFKEARAIVAGEIEGQREEDRLDEAAEPRSVWESERRAAVMGRPVAERRVELRGFAESDRETAEA